MSEPTMETIAQELHDHIDVLMHPTITKSVFNEATALDDVDRELDLKMIKEAASFRVSFTTAKIFDVYVVEV
jgi:hypothetical protein